MSFRNHETNNIAYWLENDPTFRLLIQETNCQDYYEFKSTVKIWDSKTPDGVRFDRYDLDEVFLTKVIKKVKESK